MFHITTQSADYLSIVTTHECNKACPFCIDKYRGTKEFISLQSVEKALLFAKGSAIKDILLVGGEPTLHPEIVEIARLCRSYGFHVIMTTNYTKPEIVQEVCKHITSLNISNYGQKNLPKKNELPVDVTLSTLIYKGHYDTVDALDRLIDTYADNYILKFSTLTNCNDFTRQNSEVNFLDYLPGERFILFNEILGQSYRGCVIKRYDRVVNKVSLLSYKCHVDGNITQSWDRNNIKGEKKMTKKEAVKRPKTKSIAGKDVSEDNEEKAFAKAFSELSDIDKKEVMNLIDFKHRYKESMSR